MAAKQKPNKLVLATTAVVHVFITALTWRSLRHRPAAQIRGNKSIWRLASSMNTLGSAA